MFLYINMLHACVTSYEFLLKKNCFKQCYLLLLFFYRQNLKPIAVRVVDKIEMHVVILVANPAF